MKHVEYGNCPQISAEKYGLARYEKPAREQLLKSMSRPNDIDMEDSTAAKKEGENGDDDSDGVPVDDVIAAPTTPAPAPAKNDDDGINDAASYHRCPLCLRVFKSATGLVAHCETASSRCLINRSSSYGKLMADISAGLLKTSGTNLDGTMRYEAGKGAVDLANVKW